MRKSILSLSLLAGVLVLFSACNSGKSDKESIVGIWHVVDYRVGPMKMGDGKCWFEFKADGSMATRADAYAYEQGTYELDEANHILKMRDSNPDDGKPESQLNYEVKGDSLRLFETKSAVPYLLNLRLVRTAKYPITKEEELAAAPYDDSNAATAPADSTH